MTSNIIKDKGGGAVALDGKTVSPPVRLLDWEKEFEKICYEIDVGDGDFLYQRKSDVNKIKSIIKKVRQQAVNETIEKVEEMIEIMWIKKEKDKTGHDVGWNSALAELEARLKQLSQLKIKNKK